MSTLTIYTIPWCSYCHAAKALLTRKGVKFDEIDVSHDPEERRRMTARAKGRRTVPQMFIGDTYLGDCDRIHDLDAVGKLDPLLALVEA
ncbi:MAG: glutaredoxin 3 [Rhizobiales bacterium]|nr:glutaredoxin 3 [Hyphomicrobiales bacterium]MBI3672808.1 glutaredoxin 3 [Hyphomicrobiales bacterium]